MFPQVLCYNFTEFLVALFRAFYFFSDSVLRIDRPPKRLFPTQAMHGRDDVLFCHSSFTHITESVNIWQIARKEVAHYGMPIVEGLQVARYY